MFDFLNPKIRGFGIDLSDLSIKIVNLKKAKTGFSLVSFGRQEIKTGLIEEGEIRKENELVETIRQAVRRVKGKRINTKYCVASLPETESFIRIIQLPMMKKEEVNKAIKWEIEANIPLSLEEIYFDWQIIESPLTAKKQTQQLDILVGALPKKTVDPYLNVFKKAGLKPFAFEIESIATARALIKASSHEQPLMIIDLGAKRTSLIIFSSQTIYFTTSLPISNNLFVATLAEKLKIDPKKARQMKFKIGCDYQHPEGPIYQALEPVLLELIAKIKTYLDFYDNHPASSLAPAEQINKILLCGGGANMAGLSEFLSDHLKIKIEIGDPWVNVFQGPLEKVPPLLFHESLSYATALGLALRGQE